MQGVIICGVCGKRMTLRYHLRHGRQTPTYVCQRDRIEYGDPVCQHIPGDGIDKAIGDLLLESVTPAAIEVAIRVQEKMQERIEEVDSLHRQSVDRALYEVELARRRFMQVDPENRLVADALEADWNQKLRAHEKAREKYEKQCKANRVELTEQQWERINAIATDFPALWNDPDTPHREHKRMVRLLIEDVTLIREKKITAHIRFKGGAKRTLSLPIPKSAGKMRKTPKQIVVKIDKLLDSHTDGQIAGILNDRGFLSGSGKPFTGRIIQTIKRTYDLRSRYERLRDSGLLTVHEMAELLNVCFNTVQTWRDQGLLLAVPYNDKNECLYPHPGPNPPTKQQGTKYTERQIKNDITSNSHNEVQYET